MASSARRRRSWTRSRKFAAIYGPVTWVKESDWSNTIVEWVTFRSSRFGNVKLPVVLLLDASRIRWLEPYFRLYPNTGFGKVVSKTKITVPRV